MKRKPKGEKIYYYQAKPRYERGVGPKPEHLGPASFEQAGNYLRRKGRFSNGDEDGFRHGCELLYGRKERLLTSRSLLVLRNHQVLEEKEWKRVLERLFDDIPLALALVSRKDSGELSRVLNVSIAKAISDSEWKSKDARGLGLPEPVNVGKLLRIRKDPNFQTLPSPPTFESMSTQENLDPVSLGSKNRITLPKDELQDWIVQNEEIPVRRTSQGLELVLESSGQYAPSGDIKDPRKNVGRLIRFFNSFFFHTLHESQTMIKDINDTKENSGKVLEIFESMGGKERTLIFSVFDRCLPIRLISRWAEDLGRRLAEGSISSQDLENILKGHS